MGEQIVHRRLTALRRRFGYWLMRRVSGGWALIMAAVLYAAVLLFPWAGNGTRLGLAALLVAGLAVHLFLVARRARPLFSLPSFARYLQSEVGGVRQDFETALALEDQAHADPVARALADAHRLQTRGRLDAVPQTALSKVHDRRFDAAALILWAGLVVLLVLAPDRIDAARRAWLKWDGDGLLAGVIAAPNRLAAEFTFDITPPAHTGLEPERVVGGGELLRAYKGSDVRTRIRLQRKFEAVRLELPGAGVVDLQGADGAWLGKFAVLEKGPFRLSVREAGEWIEDATERNIEVVADEAPVVRLREPADGIELNPAEDVQIGFEAGDDFGFTKAALVVDTGTGERRFAMPVSRDVTSFSAQKIFNLAEWEAREGAVVQYYVEVFDNDTLSGPKRGTSARQRIEVYSPSKHHAELLERQTRLGDLVVHVLADQIELPERFAAEVGPKLAGLLMRLRETESEFIALTAAFRLDPIADKAATFELEALGRRVSAFRREVDEYAGAVSAGTGAPPYQGFRMRGIGEMEDVAIALLDLIRRGQMSSVLATADDLERARDELRRMMEEYRANPSPEKLADLKRKIAEIKQLMARLAEQQMAMAESLPEEFINSDAFEKAREADPSHRLDDLEKALAAEDDPESLLEAMENFEQGLGDMLAKLDQAGRQATSEVQAGPYQALSKALEEVTELEKGQRKLADETRKQSEEQQKADEREAAQAKEKIARELEKLRREAQVLRDKSAMSTLWNRGFSFHAPQSMAQIDRARNATNAGDWPGAREALQRAESYLRSMQNQAEFDVQAKIGGGLSQELRSESAGAADHAGEIRKMMEAPSPRPDQAEMEKLEQAQGKLEERLEQLRQSLDAKESEAPMPRKSRDALDGGQQVMREARQKLEGREAPAAAMKADEAADRLAEARQSLEELKQEMEQQAAGSGQEGGQEMRRAGRSDPKEKVEIPQTATRKGDRRDELMKGLREGLPRAYEELNKKYYDRLVK